MPGMGMLGSLLRTEVRAFIYDGSCRLDAYFNSLKGLRCVIFNFFNVIMLIITLR
jgi:hypothetical protein